MKSRGGAAGLYVGLWLVICSLAAVLCFGRSSLFPDGPSGKDAHECQVYCDASPQGYQSQVRIKLHKGSRTARPPCACVQRGGKIILGNDPENADSKWEVHFNGNPFRNQGSDLYYHNHNVREEDSERDVAENAQPGAYHYTATLDHDTPIDPHVVVGP